MIAGKRVVPVFALAWLALLTWYSVLFARADLDVSKGSEDSLRKAIQLVPGNALYHALLAAYVEESGANPGDELKRATELNPWDSGFWAQRAYQAEIEQRYDEAEAFLFQSYRANRRFDSRWALMNFYFRRGRTAEFWKEAREAMDMSYGNLDPVFRLCLATNQDPQATLRILPPGRRDILSEFFSYLIKNNNLESAAPIAEELARDAGPADVPALVDYCDGRIAGGGSALTVWNSLCERHLLPFSGLFPDQGRIVTNGDFTAAPLQRAFDWKPVPTDGVSIGPLDGEPGISITVSGRQPDKLLRVIEEEIPLSPGRRYEVQYEYRLVSDQPDSGLQWMIRGARPDDDSAEPVAASPIFSGKDWSKGQFEFAAGPRDAATLVLVSHRLPGTLRWKGTLELRRVSSALAQHD